MYSLLIKVLSLFSISQVAYLAFLFIAFFAVLFGVGAIICFWAKAKKKAQPISDKLKYCTIAMALIFGDMIYTVLNFGWCRYGLSIYYTVQSVLMIWGACVTAPHIKKSGIFKLLFVFNCILYTVPRVVLPDSLANDLYGFFGLVQYGDFWGHVLLNVSVTCTIAHIVLCIVQIIVASRLNKRCRSD